MIVGKLAQLLWVGAKTKIKGKLGFITVFGEWIYFPRREKDPDET